MPRHTYALGAVVGMLLLLSGGVAGAQPAQKPAAPAKKEAPHIEGELLIWSGGKTRAEAERQRQDAAAYLEALDSVLPLSSEVVESARVPGLKRGFFIVVLGLCPKDKVTAPLGVLKAVNPEVYTRSVKYTPGTETPALECPELESVASNSADEPVYWELERVESVEKGGQTLTALAFTYHWSEVGDFARAYHSFKGIYLLVGKKRRLMDSKVQDGPSDATNLESFSAEGERIVAALDYGDPPCDPRTDHFKGWKSKTTVSIGKDGLEVSEDTPTLIKEGSCGYAEEERMVTGQGYLDAQEEQGAGSQEPEEPDSGSQQPEE